MFKIIILVIFLLLMYLLLRKEKKSVKYGLLIYFLLLSIVFLSGQIYISSTYHLSDNPIEDGFGKLYDWVSLFLYLYLVPLLIIIGYKLFKITHESFRNTWAKIMMLILSAVVIVVIVLVLPFIFVLIFYGFAP